jgi:hypothetical protein
MANVSASSERGYQRLRLRQDTQENWLKNDPVLASGELAYTVGGSNPDGILKCGDGTVRWSQLPYLSRGVSGPPGPRGYSAYEIWLNAGNSGTEQDFLDSLVGPQGPAGP